MSLTLQDNYILIDVYVQPGAKVSQVCGMHGDRLKLKVNSPPVDGKANQEVIEFFATILKLPRRNISIISGEKARNKRVAIDNIVPNSIEILRELYK